MRMLYSILIAKIDILFGLAFNRRDKSVEEDTNVLYAGYFELSNKKTGTGLTTHACLIYVNNLKFNIMKTHLFFDSRQLACAVADDDVIQFRLVPELLRIRFKRLFYKRIIFLLFY